MITSRHSYTKASHFDEHKPGTIYWYLKRIPADVASIIAQEMARAPKQYRDNRYLTRAWFENESVMLTRVYEVSTWPTLRTFLLRYYASDEFENIKP